MRMFWISLALTNIIYIVIYLATDKFYIPLYLKVFLAIYLFVLIFFILDKLEV